MKILSIMCSLALFSSSCATMFADSKKRIVVKSDDPRAKIYINNRYLGKGSATTKVKAFGSEVVSGKKNGCQTTIRTVDKVTHWGWFLIGNCLTYACLGMIVDLATGAWRGVDEEYYIVTPSCG